MSTNSDDVQQIIDQMIHMGTDCLIVHKTAVDASPVNRHTYHMTERSMHIRLQDHYLTAKEFARAVPGSSPRSVRHWCAAGRIEGAYRLPSGRWQIPWSAVVGILGFDPRLATVPAGDPLPGLGE